MKTTILSAGALLIMLGGVPLNAVAQERGSGDRPSASSPTPQDKRPALRVAPLRTPNKAQSKQLNEFIQNNEAQIRAAAAKGC